METTVGKIKNGTIRVENGKLIGLGKTNSDSIDIEALERLIEFASKREYVEIISNTVCGVGEVYSSLLDRKEDEVSEFVNEWIFPALPRRSDIYALNQLLKFFNT